MSPGKVEGQPHRPSVEERMNPLAQALAIEELRGEQGVFAVTLTTALQGMSGTLNAIQADLGKMEDKVDAVVAGQAELRAHSSGFERLSQQIIADRNEWRAWVKDHEANNEKIADAVKAWKGLIVGFSIFGALLISAATTIVTINFNYAAERRGVMQINHDKLERRVDALEGRRPRQ